MSVSWEPAERDRKCPRCGAEGPILFVRYNALGAIIECRALVDGAVCGRRRQVDFP